MKDFNFFYKCLILFIIISGVASAQWINQSFGSSASFSSVSFVDEDKGWFVGTDGA